MIRFIILVCAIPLTACQSLGGNQKIRTAFYPNVTYFQNESVQLSANIYRPLIENAPIVLVIQAGNWSRLNGDMQSIGEDLAKNGFLAYVINYRLPPTYVYPSQLTDVKKALEFVREDAKKFFANTGNISVWGYATGGYLALMAGLNPDLGFKAVVAGAATTDLSEYPHSPEIAKFLGAPYSKKSAKAWEEASPVNSIHEKSPPVFMYHGTRDTLVDIDQMMLMKEALEKKKIHVVAQAVEGLGHVEVYLISQASINEGIRFLKHVNGLPVR